MVEINNGEELETWLNGRPRDDAALIAGRVALRVFPLLAPVIERNAEETRANIILPVCRAMAVASVAGIWPTLATEVRLATAAAFRAVAGAANATSSAANGAAAAAAEATAVADTNDAVARATAASTNAARAMAIAFADVASGAESQAVNTAKAAAFVSVSRDGTLLEQGVEHDQFTARRLWLEQFPGRDPGSVAEPARSSAGRGR